MLFFKGVNMYNRVYDVEQKIDGLVWLFQSLYGLSNDWLGDCYPIEILRLEDRMELAKNDEEYNMYYQEAYDLLQFWAKDAFERESLERQETYAKQI